MTRSAAYDELLADGLALRRRLAAMRASAELVDDLVREIRSWEVRCATAVAVRNPELVAAFRTETGPLDRLRGEAWFLAPGWQVRLDGSLGQWLRALERVQRIGSAERHADQPLTAK